MIPFLHRAEMEPFLRPGHGHIKETPLLLNVRRKPRLVVGDDALVGVDDKYDPVFQPFGAVHGGEGHSLRPARILCISSLYLSLLFIQYIQESVQIFMIIKFNFDLTRSLSLRCNGYFSSKLLFQFFFNILVDHLHGFIIYFFGLCRFM